MNDTLIQVSVALSENAEEPIAVICEKLFGQAPSIYTDAESGKTTASIFIRSNKSRAPQQIKEQLANELFLLREAGIDIGSGAINIKKIRRENWAESWKKHFKPIEIGNTLLIKPSWSKRRPSKNQACVVLDPGLSFGTGQHATTSFCLEQLVRCRKPGEAQSFLDIGTGSGILAISAANLGYAPVRAFDFDPESVRVSRNNAEQNGVSDRVRPVRRDLTKISLQSKTKFDLVCANLIYDVLLGERKKIANRVAHSGSLILAGILREQFARVEKAFAEIDLKLACSKTRKEWKSGRFIFRI
jgi:ribosomal protein L11 methyltransferase